MQRTIIQLLLFALAGICGITAPSYANVLTFNFNTVFSGDTPVGSNPWLRASFDDHGAVGAVDLTVTTGTGWNAGQFISALYFNFDSTITDLLATYVSGVTGTTSIAQDTFKADGDGRYDILIDLPTAPPSARLTLGTETVWHFTGTGLDSSDFSFLSAPEGGHGPFLAAAHVQGIGTIDCSGWISPSDYPTTTPSACGGSPPPPPPPPLVEPFTMAIFGGGLLGLGLVRRRT